MPNVVKVAMRFSIAPSMGIDPVPPEIEDVVVTFHVQALDSHDPPSLADCDALAATAAAWWVEEGVYSPGLRDFYLGSTILVDVAAHPVEPAIGDGVLLAVDVEGGITGAGLTAPLPPQNAFVIGLRTLEDSRRGRGRMYLPPFEGSFGSINHTGLIDEAGRDTLGALGQELAFRIRFYENEGVQQWALAVYSRVAGDSHAVIGFVVPDRVCTQRRRAYRPLAYTTYDLVPPP